MPAISGTQHPISAVFSDGFQFSIPSYQRPYAWTKEQIGELLSDLYSAFNSEPDGNYFLGSVVVIKAEGDPSSQVIDGQQRLTSMTIVLSCIAQRINNAEVMQELRRYINSPGIILQRIPARPRLELRERDQDFFRRFVQEMNYAGLVNATPQELCNEARKNIRENSIETMNFIAREFGEDNNRLLAFASFIINRCILIVVSTTDASTAFRVFSVMNSRGLDLQATDVLKADVIGDINEDQQSDYTEAWEEMEEETGRAGLEDLFRHIRMIINPVKARNSLLASFRQDVLERQEFQDRAGLIDDLLIPYADSYCTAKARNYASPNGAAQWVNSILGCLNQIEHSDWLPPAILILKQHRNDAAHCLGLLNRLERLSAYLYLCGVTETSRIDRMAPSIRSLKIGEDPLDLNLTDDEKVRFLNVLSGNVYTDLPPRKRRYVLQRLDTFISDNGMIAAYDASVFTIEHVLPQTINDGSPWLNDWPDQQLRERWLHKISNLVPLTRRHNAAAQNFSFDLKKATYFTNPNGVASFPLTTSVIAEESWTPAVVERRQDFLLNIFKENWGLEA